MASSIIIEIDSDVAASLVEIARSSHKSVQGPEYQALFCTALYGSILLSVDETVDVFFTHLEEECGYLYREDRKVNDYVFATALANVLETLYSRLQANHSYTLKEIENLLRPNLNISPSECLRIYVDPYLMFIEVSDVICLRHIVDP